MKNSGNKIKKKIKNLNLIFIHKKLKKGFKNDTRYIKYFK